MKDLKQRFLTEFFFYIHKFEQNNWDYFRFPNGNPRKDNFLVDQATREFSFIIDNIDRFNYVYNLLKDDESKSLMLKLMQYRVLDHHHVRLPLNTEKYWAECETINRRYLLKENAIKSERQTFNLYFYPEMNIKFYGSLLTVLTIFLCKQYLYRKTRIIKPELGDIAIDAGSCRGDVALHFAHHVGPTGQVHAFEFVDSNLDILKKNLNQNYQLAPRITIIKKALFDTSNQKLYYDDRGSSTSVITSTQSNTFTESITIDDYATVNQLPSIDFIKMDIEGAEEKALMGAMNTIKKFTPKLAICVYHRPSDLFLIPMIIQRINPNYEFYLDHYSIHKEETVLYATKKR